MPIGMERTYVESKAEEPMIMPSDRAIKKT
jgi:hypothetical protein